MALLVLISMTISRGINDNELPGVNFNKKYFTDKLVYIYSLKILKVNSES